jgi:hypothetical protein
LLKRRLPNGKGEMIGCVHQCGAAAMAILCALLLPWLALAASQDDYGLVPAPPGGDILFVSGIQAGSSGELILGRLPLCAVVRLRRR